MLKTDVNTSSELLLENIRCYTGLPSDDPNRISILIRNGIIQEMGRFPDLKNRNPDTAGAKSIDCSHLIAIPGLVDSHTHLLFFGTRENEFYMRAQGHSYLEILNRGGGIYNTVRDVRRASREQLLKNGLKFLDLALEYGITTVEVKTGYGLDYDSEKKMLEVMQELNRMHPVDIIPTFLVHTVPKDIDRTSYLQDVQKRWIPEFREHAEWFDLFLESGVFDCLEAEKLLSSAADSGYFLGLHTNQINDIGGIALADSMGVRHVDHLEVLSDQDADRIKKNPEMYAVFLPASETFVFSNHVGQIQKLLDIPSRLVLSSDFNPGSSPVLSPYFVMAVSVLRYHLSSCRLILQAYTANPAKMFYLEDRGIISPGKKADLVLLNLENLEQIPYFGAMNFVEHVIKDGSLVYSKS